MLALVSDAFGGRGGIAQYNRDFLSAAATAKQIESIEILPRHAGGTFSLPPKLHQVSPAASRLSYVRRAFTMCMARKPGLVFCGHINLAPLAAAV